MAALRPAGKLSRSQGAIGPYSRALARGSLGVGVDGRSAEGRFARHLEHELTLHVGGEPSIAQKLLIDQAIKIKMQLDALNEKLSSGNWTDHDRRTFGGLLNCFRLTLREIGLKPPKAARPESLVDYWAGKAAAEPVEHVNGAAAQQTASPARIVLRRPGAAP